MAMFRIFHASRWLATLLAFCSASSGSPAPVSPGELFDPGRAHTIQIRISSEGWDLLQPGAGTQKASGATNRAQGKMAGVRLRPRFPAYAYVRSEIEFDGKHVAN